MLWARWLLEHCCIQGWALITYRNFQDITPNGEEGWSVWEWQQLHIVASSSTKVFNFGVFYSGLASNPGTSWKSRMSAGCSWSHVASSFWLSPRSFFSSQRPPPHSLSWTSWYWKRKMQCVCLRSGTATTKLRYCMFGLPSPGCCGVPDWSRSCSAVYRFGTVVPRPPPSERWWPHPRLGKLKAEEKKKRWLRESLVGWPLKMKACKSIPSKAVGVAAMHSWMHEFRIPTRIFGLKVEETSEAEALHFPRRKNVIPVEKKALLGPFQEFNTVKFLLNGLKSLNFL